MCFSFVLQFAVLPGCAWMRHSGGSGGRGGGGGASGVSFQRRIPNFLKGLVNEDGKALRDTQGPVIENALEDREDGEDEAPMIVADSVVEAKDEAKKKKKEEKKRSNQRRVVVTDGGGEKKEKPKKKSKVQLSFNDDL
jgi:hypothetical protein